MCDWPRGQNPGRRPAPSRRASARETQEPRRTEFEPRGQHFVRRAYAASGAARAPAAKAAAELIRLASVQGKQDLLVAPEVRRVRELGLLLPPLETSAGHAFLRPRRAADRRRGRRGVTPRCASSRG